MYILETFLNGIAWSNFFVQEYIDIFLKFLT